MTAPGWYQDPWGSGSLRYFDGHNWTGYLHAPAAPGVQVLHVTQVSHAPPRSVGLALLLTFFFGPLGMLYSTVVGGLVMLGLGFVLGILTFGLWFFVAWPIQMIWAAVAAANSGHQSTTNVATATHAGGPPPVAPTPPNQPPAPMLPPAQQWTHTPVDQDIVDAELIDPNRTAEHPHLAPPDR